MGVPFVIGMGFLLLGVVLLVLWRLRGNERFFGRRPFEAVDPAVLVDVPRTPTKEANDA
ncbi:MAG TPA: hypothetical protein VFL61_01815 [Gaiellaceae bacterium]|nr:hypothetical protein [Gaiellaceae bacterium]